MGDSTETVHNWNGRDLVVMAVLIWRNDQIPSLVKSTLWFYTEYIIYKSIFTSRIHNPSWTKLRRYPWCPTQEFSPWKRAKLSCLMVYCWWLTESLLEVPNECVDFGTSCHLCEVTVGLFLFCPVGCRRNCCDMVVLFAHALGPNECHVVIYCTHAVGLKL